MLAKVTGWKFFQGNIDSKDIDSGRLFVELPLDTSRQNAKGTCTAEMRVPDSACIKRIQHLPLPSMMDLEVETIADGKNGFRQVVRDVKPVESPVKKAA